MLINRISQEQFEAVFSEITKTDLPRMDRKHWSFDWKKEVRAPDRQVYKLTTLENPDVIQGLISLTEYGDHIFVNLVESAVFNRGKDRLYTGVSGSLFAFACQQSFDKGYEGYVVLESKTKLINHYQKLLGAQRFGNSIRMFINTPAAYALIKLHL